MALWIYSVGLFAIAFFLAGEPVGVDRHHATNGEKHATVSPKWRTDLRPAIGGTPLGEVYGRGREYKALPHTSLSFIDNKTVVATFVIREEKTSLPSRNGSNDNLPGRLRPVFIDSDTGKVTSVPDWPTASVNAGIIAVNNGMVVVQAGNELSLFSSEMKLLRKLALPSLKEGEWWASPSPTGKNILFTQPGHKTGLWLWLETDTLKISHSWEDNETGDVAIADDVIAMVTCTWSLDCPRSVEIRGLNTDWQIVAAGHSQSYPRFVDANTLFLSGKPTTLIRADGKVVFTNEEGLNSCYLPKVYPLASGQRFVAPECDVKGAIAILDVGGHAILRRILIHDGSLAGWSYSLDVKGPTIMGLAQFAISPDGRRLAVMNDGSVEMLELPPLGSAGQ
jgi:hypothetical protein